MGNENYALIHKVICASEADTWEDAVQEWTIFDCEEDDECASTCICGKEGLRYLYTIKNQINGKTLYPIGSSCIRKFENDALNEELDIREGMFKLYKAIRNEEEIEPTSDFFSRKLIAAFYDAGAFPGNKYNNYDGYNDYKFFLDMFNKRIKSRITDRQYQKFDMIVRYSLKPYLVRTLGPKIREKGNFRVIIAGGRDFTDYELLCRKLDHILKNVQSICVVCGEAKGADSLGRRYAKEHGYDIDSFPANWEKYGKQAGYIRNKKMADNANALVAFWNGKSKGTAHMIEAARKEGLEVRVVRYNSQKDL